MNIGGPHTKNHLPFRTSTRSTRRTSLVSHSYQINILENIFDMAQNINIIQYALMPPGGPQLAPAGQTYQLTATSLIGEISFRRSVKRKITKHKRAMGIAVGLQGHAIYGAWWDTVKDLMLASVTILLWWRLVIQQVTNYLREDLELSLYFSFV